MLPYRDVRIYRVCQMALREASVGRHDVLLAIAVMEYLKRLLCDGCPRSLVLSAMWQDGRNDNARVQAILKTRREEGAGPVSERLTAGAINHARRIAHHGTERESGTVSAHKFVYIPSASCSFTTISIR